MTYNAVSCFVLVNILILKVITSNCEIYHGSDEINKAYSNLRTKLDDSMIKLNRIKQVADEISQEIDKEMDRGLNLTQQFNEECALESQLKLEQLRNQLQVELKNCTFLQGLIKNVDVLLKDGGILVQNLLDSSLNSVNREVNCFNKTNSIACFLNASVATTEKISVDSWSVAKFTFQVNEFDDGTLEMIWSCVDKHMIKSAVQYIVNQCLQCHLYQSLISNGNHLKK